MEENRYDQRAHLVSKSTIISVIKNKLQVIIKGKAYLYSKCAITKVNPVPKPAAITPMPRPFGDLSNIHHKPIAKQSRIENC